MITIRNVLIIVTFDDDSQHTYDLSEVRKFNWNLETITIEPEPGDEWIHHEPTGFINIDMRGKLATTTKKG